MGHLFPGNVPSRLTFHYACQLFKPYDRLASIVVNKYYSVGSPTKIAKIEKYLVLFGYYLNQCRLSLVASVSNVANIPVQLSDFLDTEIGTLHDLAAVFSTAELVSLCELYRRIDTMLEIMLRGNWARTHYANRRFLLRQLHISIPQLLFLGGMTAVADCLTPSDPRTGLWYKKSHLHRAHVPTGSHLANVGMLPFITSPTPVLDQSTATRVQIRLPGQ